jgi:hypothetical protein
VNFSHIPKFEILKRDTYPSAVFHAKTSTGSPWMARTLSQCHPWSTVGCRPTQRLSTLLSLRAPINTICANTQLNACCNRAQPTRSLINTGGAYHLRSFEYENRPFSTFPSDILHFPLVAPPGLTWSYKSNCEHKPHRTSIVRRGSIASSYQPLVFYREPILLSIVILSF